MVHIFYEMAVGPLLPWPISNQPKNLRNNLPRTQKPCFQNKSTEDSVLNFEFDCSTKIASGYLLKNMKTKMESGCCRAWKLLLHNTIQQGPLLMSFCPPAQNQQVDLYFQHSPLNSSAGLSVILMQFLKYSKLFYPSGFVSISANFSRVL